MKIKPIENVSECINAQQILNDGSTANMDGTWWRWGSNSDSKQLTD